MSESSDSQQQANMFSSKNKPEKPRHRASVACSACRDRRTRCVVPAGESKCTQCRDAGHECVIKHDDERRKPNSKAYVSSLRDKIAHLESLLEEREQQSANRSPAPQHASLAARDVDNEQNILRANNNNTFDFAIPQIPLAPELPNFAQNDIIIDGHSPTNSVHSTSSSTRSTMVHRLLSTKGHLSFDQLSGRLRYYGPTTNCHVLSDLAAENEEHNRQALEQRRRTQRVLSTLPQETQDYLMEMFWQYYNSVIHVIHQAAFEEGMVAGQGQFYSPFLHICVLGIGYRHADKSRLDIMKISLPGKESTLHREAKYMLDYELERPGGITSVQALLLLGDLECGVGRDNLGWLISGMANRLCFDVGLHLDNSASGLSQLEVEIGRMTLWACVIYDRYWALFLGRPTALKPEDLEVYRLAQDFERLGTLEPAGPDKSREKQVYEALLDLMELAGKITEIVDKASKPNVQLDTHVYIKMSALSRELETWYARLPYFLSWTQDNIDSAPFSYFLLHQQYHAAMILLHRQFAQYDDFVPGSSEHGSEDGDFAQASHFATLSRMTCTRSAGRIAQIFWQHRRQYDTKKIFVTGLQHAGTAAIALVAAVASPKDRVQYDTNMKYLECLAAAIGDMCETYQPAERMSSVLNAVLAELKAARPPRQYSSMIPTRRDSSASRDTDLDFVPAKRHQTTRPGATSRTISQLSQPPLYLSHQSRRHTTTGTAAPISSGFISQPQGNLGQESPRLNEPTNNFVLMPADSDPQDLTSDWPKFDDTNPFTMDDAIISTSFGRPATPSQFRSAWMGAETPTFSPLPTGTSATAFANHTASLLDTSNNDRQNHNVFTSNTSLDFMSMLNNADHTANDSIQSNDAGKQQQQQQQAFTSLPTPTSQTGSMDPPSSTTKSSSMQNNSKSRPPRSRSHSTQRASSNGGGSGGSGDNEGRASSAQAAQTMAGLDDIWKEMMRTNERTSVTSGPVQGARG